MGRIELVDFLKGLSILTIVLLHILQGLDLPFPFDKIILLGGTGVHMFVLLSGFGLYMSQMKKPLGWFAFLRKRAGKIYWPYAGLVVVTAALSLVWPLFPVSWYAFWGHLLLYKMFDESIIGSYGYQLWFISMIIQFYLIFHLLLLLKHWLVSLRNFLIVSFIISLCWSFGIIAAGLESYRIWNSFFLQFLWEFSLGITLAELYSKGKLTYKVAPFAWPCAGILGVGLFGLMALKGGAIGRALNDLPALLGYGSLAVWLYLWKWSPLNKLLLFTGKISYELFLIHMLIIHAADLMLDGLSRAKIIAVPLSLLGSYAAAWAWSSITQQIVKHRLRSPMP
jgi:peptidoglycan/LPS O-acetylase OafA/YrhL